jgi:hypothetical protein
MKKGQSFPQTVLKRVDTHVQKQKEKNRMGESICKTNLIRG